MSGVQLDRVQRLDHIDVQLDQLQVVVAENRRFLAVHPRPLNLEEVDASNDIRANRRFLAEHPRPIISTEEADALNRVRRSARESKAPKRYGFE